jgi:fused signal recognition particle receptor
LDSRPGLLGRLRESLARTRQAVASRLDAVLGLGVGEGFYQALEETLIQADVGVRATDVVLERLRERVRAGARTPGALREALAEILVADGRKVLLAAADTFRAAAIDQLDVWAGRAGVEVVGHREGADPAAVVYDAAQATRARHVDVLIVDTAGRLHTKANLLDELTKMDRVLRRELPGAPVETLLVLDATTGQNGIAQARQFTAALPVTGIVLTKLDGTARGGIVVAIAEELGLPVKLVGVGEGPDDLQPFDARVFVQALLAPEGGALPG